MVLPQLMRFLAAVAGIFRFFHGISMYLFLAAFYNDSLCSVYAVYRVIEYRIVMRNKTSE